MFLTFTDSIFSSFSHFDQFTPRLHVLRPLPRSVLLSDSLPAAALWRPPPLSRVQLIMSTPLSVTDSWLKWLWQHTEAWRIHFQAAPESAVVPICQPKTGACTISHSWPPVSHAGGLVGRGKTQSNTNKHEDQQMAVSQSSFFFHLAVFSTSFTYSFLGRCVLLFLFLPRFPLSLHLFLCGAAAECDCSSVRCSSLPPNTA